MAPSNNTGQQLLSFTLEYGFLEGEARAPEDWEVIDLICKTNLFFLDTLQNATGDSSIQSEAIHPFNWSYTENVPFPVKVNGTANVTDGTGEAVDKETVYHTMDLAIEQIVMYIEQYVWNAAQNSLFLQTISVNFTNIVSAPAPSERYDSVVCVQPSAVPTTTSGPTALPAPFGLLPQQPLHHLEAQLIFLHPLQQYPNLGAASRLLPVLKLIHMHPVPWFLVQAMIRWSFSRYSTSLLKGRLMNQQNQKWKN
jgi:hypothetical protein